MSAAGPDGHDGGRGDGGRDDPPKQNVRRAADDESSGSGVRSIVILVVVVVLVAGAVWMAQRLRSAGRVQDCVMAGRSNCTSGQ